MDRCATVPRREAPNQPGRRQEHHHEGRIRSARAQSKMLFRKPSQPDSIAACRKVATLARLSAARGAELADRQSGDEVDQRRYRRPTPTEGKRGGRANLVLAARECSRERSDRTARILDSVHGRSHPSCGLCGAGRNRPTRLPAAWGHRRSSGTSTRSEFRSQDASSRLSGFSRKLMIVRQNRAASAPSITR